MNDALEKKLVDFCKADGGDGSKDEMLEVLSEAVFDSVKDYGHDKHRWYTSYNTVVKIGNMFVDYLTHSNSGDEDALCGAGEKIMWDTAVEVFPTEVKVIKYVTEDKL